MRIRNSPDVLKVLSDRKKTGKISHYVIEEMLSSVSILDVLEREYDLYFESSSNNWWNTNCPMPGHNDRSPSFGVNPDLGIFRCFGCSEKGNLLTFIQKVDGLSFPEAVARLSVISGIGIDDTQGELHRTVRDVKDAIEDYLSREAETDLPGGMGEVTFMHAVANRIKEFEQKADHSAEAIEFSDSLYNEMDSMIYVQDHQGMKKFWSGLGQRMREKLATIEHEVQND